jgi:hypothetical protein
MATDEIEARQVRAARNQSLFREVNERLEEVTGQFSTFHEFVCECASPECTETMSLTHAEYERVRASARHFAIRPGHNLPDAERVIEQEDGRYIVVEKIETAARVATHFDPRTRTKI